MSSPSGLAGYVFGRWVGDGDAVRRAPFPYLYRRRLACLSSVPRVYLPGSLAGGRDPPGGQSLDLGIGLSRVGSGAVLCREVLRRAVLCRWCAAVSCCVALCRVASCAVPRRAVLCGTVRDSAVLCRTVPCDAVLRGPVSLGV